jgi:hypothetical protein
MHCTNQSFLKKKEYAPWADSVDMADDKSGAFLRNHEWGLLFHNNVYVTHHTLPHSAQCYIILIFLSGILD